MMKKSEQYLPEGSRTAPNAAPFPVSFLREAVLDGRILEATASRCTAAHDLLFALGGAAGLMPRESCCRGIDDGSAREIAILSRVGRPTCFVVTLLDESTTPPTALLSRTDAQTRAESFFLQTLQPGDVIPARVTHLEPFGAFVDIGCGLPSLIGIENLSVSRIRHPADRLTVGQNIYAVVRAIDRESGRISLSHRELLGTWSENAALFETGETVQGIVRSIESYGVFIELAPNLSGLAEKREDLSIGQRVSVYIKSILPARMKIKLAIIETFPGEQAPTAPYYFIREGHLDRWLYSTPECREKYIETLFS